MNQARLLGIVVSTGLSMPVARKQQWAVAAPKGLQLFVRVFLHAIQSVRFDHLISRVCLSAGQNLDPDLCPPIVQSNRVIPSTTAAIHSPGSSEQLGGEEMQSRNALM